MSAYKKSLPIIVLITATLTPTAHHNPVVAQDTEQATATNDYWWPNRLDLEPLRANTLSPSPMGSSFDYEKEFESLDLDALKADLTALMTRSQDWWPADYGHYGPLFIRMSWHSAGTYRTIDGRGGADGGMQRFAPLNSWPDNANLDKAQRLLWPIKKKYGQKISWSDLLVLAGTVAMESMGFKTLGFAGGREDAWTAKDIFWGPEGKWLASDRHEEGRKLKGPLAATRMGLIYVNPEGPDGVPDPIAAAKDIRETFSRMAMNDEETVALIAGGHTFGKAHGAASPSGYVGPEPEAASLEQQGLGWKNSYQSGKGPDTITSGLEGAWTINPRAWTHNFFENLFAYDWVLTESPAGAKQWMPSDEATGDMVPDAHDPDKRHAPMMLTTDLSLKFDPVYREISLRFRDNPEEFEEAFAKAWFKLTHRDMGPRSRYLGSMIPADIMTWQDPVPEADYKMVRAKDIRKLKNKIRRSGHNMTAFIKAAWASASSFRSTDMRGGANGARIRLAPQKDWAANDPAELAQTLDVLEAIQQDFNDKAKGGRKISMADLIVLAGGTAIEEAARKAGMDIEIPFAAGRTDASAEMTDAASFDVLRPTADGFRNYHDMSADGSPAEMLIDKASTLNLSIPEMTVLVGGMRVLGANMGGSKHGIFTASPGTLSNDFFVNLLDMSTVWRKPGHGGMIYEGFDRASGKRKWTATPVDLIFGSNSELRAIAEVYASDDGQDKFIRDFVAAWIKVMRLDRFDI